MFSVQQKLYLNLGKIEETDLETLYKQITDGATLVRVVCFEIPANSLGMDSRKLIKFIKSRGMQVFVRVPPVDKRKLLGIVISLEEEGVRYISICETDKNWLFDLTDKIISKQNTHLYLDLSMLTRDMRTGFIPQSLADLAFETSCFGIVTSNFVIKLLRRNSQNWSLHMIDIAENIDTNVSPTVPLAQVLSSLKNGTDAVMINRQDLSTFALRLARANN